jgi:hypothetical protein
MALVITIPGCITYLITSPINSGNDSWQVVIELLRVGPHIYSTQLIVDKYFVLTDKPNANEWSDPPKL